MPGAHQRPRAGPGARGELVEAGAAEALGGQPGQVGLHGEPEAAVTSPVGELPGAPGGVDGRDATAE
jgi:hypothetical protein